MINREEDYLSVYYVSLVLKTAANIMIISRRVRL